MRQIGMRQAMHNTVRGAELQDTKITWATLARIGGFARPYTWLIVAFLIVSVVVAVLAVATPLLAGRVVDAIVQHQSKQRVIQVASLIAAIAVLEAAIGLLARWLSSRIGESVIFDLRVALYRHIQSQPVAFFLRSRTGAIVSRINTDVVGAQRAFTSTLSGIVSNVVTLILALAVMLSISWQITILALLLLPLFLLPAQRMGGFLARLVRQGADANADLSTRTTERFNAGGAALVKLFGNPEREVDAFAERANIVRQVGVKTSMAQMTFMTGLTLVSSLALALVYGLGGWFAVEGRLKPGAVVSMAMLLTRLYQPLTGLAGARVDVMSAVVSFDRVFEVLDLEPLIQESPHPVTIPDGPVDIAFDDVRFSYPAAASVSLSSLAEGVELNGSGNDEVLHGISFTVPAGQMVAIVGSSGAGKTTISQLVSRLYDVTSGSVRLAGIDVREIALASLRATVGVVTQDGYMFHDTLRMNLSMARSEITDADMWNALRRVRLDGLIGALPDGLDTVVGERGYRFSGGERQRLAIARLLLAEPQVLILDEATAHLDSTSEVAVQQAISEALVGRTAIVIAHRLSTIRMANEILVLEAGVIVERGTHSTLLAQGGRYAELHLTQFSSDSE
ncbi:MAG: ABC transporter ATP-binding protein/permease [Thermomicrobiales bacterium]|nr:ABC transporter ATP-binding protein/permease [Thermomicrobiales bacterium]MCO5217429.1 ABC transporter ATP-binding protein/permease [Thermomicrobiales bacterium]MCO5226047.1 ABC transporter ATP-binding protein/permease [Thermomicrobiales bacterium]MCO5226733.1 ABC transporter ATP-binding protein/permease [Thermomicrobiales bacterium]